MGRKKKWPPTILPHLPSGQDRVRVDGRDVYLGPIGSEESKEAYKKLMLGGPPPSGEKVAGPTVREAVLFWEDNESSRLSEKERRHYRRALLVVLRVCGGEPAASFDSARLEDVRQAMTSASWMNDEEKSYFRKWNREPTWCAAVANRQVVRVRTVWRFLERKKQVPRGSWGELRLLRGLDARDRRVRHRPKVRAAAWADVQAVCAKLRSATLRAMLRVQWHTGMRSGEVRSMKSSEVSRSGQVWTYRPARHKNLWRGQERVVPIGPQAQAVLGPLLAATTGRVFRTRTGRGYTASTYATAVVRAARKAGLDWFVPYSARHGAKKRITAQLGLDAARCVLGQASLGTTNLYAAGADLSVALAAAAKLG